MKMIRVFILEPLSLAPARIRWGETGMRRVTPRGASQTPDRIFRRYNHTARIAYSD